MEFYLNGVLFGGEKWSCVSGEISIRTQPQKYIYKTYRNFIKKKKKKQISPQFINILALKPYVDIAINN